MTRQADGGWRVNEAGEDMGIYYLVDGVKIRCVPPEAAQAKGAEEFTVNVAGLLDIDANTDWNTVESIDVLDPRAGSDIRIVRQPDRIVFGQNTGLLEDGVELVWEGLDDFPTE